MQPFSGVVVTRPEREALVWAQQLQQAGVPAQALPLIEIGVAPDPQALQQACQDLHEFTAVMFVSANAVDGFVADCPAEQRPLALRAWATGPGTVAALLRTGWPASHIDAPADDAPLFDSEALWTQVKDQVRAGQRVLIVRGADAQGRLAGRDWLARTLASAGLQVRQCAVYTRRLPDWTAQQQGQADNALARGHWWLFSSSEAVHHLQQLWPGLPWPRLRALATHPRIAEVLRTAGCTQLHTVPAVLPAMVASIKSLAHEQGI